MLLSFYYRPSAEEAYHSIQTIVSAVTFGWLMRDAHVWAANLIVLAALVHMARVFFGAAYKPPRETNWIVGLLLLFVIFAFGATGYLLPWDQWAYWTVTEGLAIVDRVPIAGAAIVEILRGDPLVLGGHAEPVLRAARDRAAVAGPGLADPTLHAGAQARHGAAGRTRRTSVPTTHRARRSFPTTSCGR